MAFFKSKVMLLLPLIIVLLLLSACGGGDDENDQGLSGGSSNTQNVENDNANLNANDAGESNTDSANSVMGAIPAPEPDAVVLPNIPELEGRLLFTKGTNLYLGSFDGQPAQLLVEDTSAPPVFPDPNHEGTIHKSSGIRRPRLMLTNFETGESIELLSGLGAVSQLTGNVIGWSPNGEWVLLLDLLHAEWHVVSRDVSTSYTFEESIIPMWLDDNTVLQIEVDLLPFQSQLQISFTDLQPIQTAGFSRYLPDTGEIEPLLLSTDQVASPYDYDDLDQALQLNDLALAREPYTDALGNTVAMSDGTRLSIVLPPANRAFTPATCNTWSIEHLLTDGNKETVYQADNILMLARLKALDDGSALFLQWTVEDCDINGIMHVALLHLLPEGSVDEVTSEIAPVEEGRNALNTLIYTMAYRYDVSPDQQYVVWPSGSLNSRIASLNLTHLASGETATLMTASSGNTTAFLDQTMFRTVFWLE